MTNLERLELKAGMGREAETGAIGVEVEAIEMS